MVQMNDDDTTLIPANDTPPLAHRGERGKMRASDSDRDRVVERLNVAYSEGRLSKDEYDDRLENALSARTYADLDQIVADLPAARTTVVTPVARINGLAIASLPAGSRSSCSDRWRPSQRSCSATWPGIRSSGPENRGLAWRSRA
jgi:hypothetical protein